MNISEEILNKWNLLKTCIQTTFPVMGTEKREYIYIYKPVTRIKLFMSSYGKWFCIKSCKKFANLLHLCKVPGKKNKKNPCLFKRYLKES